MLALSDRVREYGQDNVIRKLIFNFFYTPGIYPALATQQVTNLPIIMRRCQLDWSLLLNGCQEI